MRRKEGAIFVALALAGCGPSAPPDSTSTAAASQGQSIATATAAAAQAPLWFICDGIDAPTLFTLTKTDDRVDIVAYDKRTGATVDHLSYGLGESEGAAGSVYTPFLRDGVQAGFARALNPGMLDEPGAAYTTPFTSIQLDGRTVACRWLARTRLAGFTGRRSFAVTEDADGDLIYTTFNFADVANQRAVDLSGSQRSTTFSLEVRGGAEQTGPNGSEFRFANAGYTYVIAAPRSGAGALTVLRNGAAVQTEPLLGYVAGQGAG